MIPDQVEFIQRFTAMAFKVPVEKLTEPDRHKQFVGPRHAAMWLCDQMLDCETWQRRPAIIEGFKRDPVGISRAIQGIKNRMDTEHSFRNHMLALYVRLNNVLHPKFHMEVVEI